jgi:preprotein translocase subunit Sec63
MKTLLLLLLLLPCCIRRHFVRVIEVTSQIYLSMTANSSEFPDYYKLLNVPKTASQDDIRQAYKRESLKCMNSALRTDSLLIARFP